MLIIKVPIDFTYIFVLFFKINIKGTKNIIENRDRFKLKTKQQWEKKI